MLLVFSSSGRFVYTCTSIFYLIALFLHLQWIDFGPGIFVFILFMILLATFCSFGLWRFINHLLTYLRTYLVCYLGCVFVVCLCVCVFICLSFLSVMYSMYDLNTNNDNDNVYVYITLHKILSE